MIEIWQLLQQLPSEGSSLPISPRSSDEVKVNLLSTFIFQFLSRVATNNTENKTLCRSYFYFIKHSILSSFPANNCSKMGYLIMILLRSSLLFFSVFLSSKSSSIIYATQQIYKSILRGKTIGRWLKDQKERKKQEIRTQNAQLHAAVSVAGVAAAVAALSASNASPETSATQKKTPPKTCSALASAAALVASHCIEIAEEMGADHEHILTVVDSAINARTNGDIMTLTAGAATGIEDFSMRFAASSIM